MNLREAAEQALEALDSMYGRNPERVEKVITALRAALAEDRYVVTGKTSDHFPDATKMVATIRPDVTVEPVAWISYESLGRLKNGGNSRGAVPVHTIQSHTAKIPLYTAPPKHKPINTDMILATWVEECIPKRSTPELIVAFARAIERSHGIGGEE